MKNTNSISSTPEDNSNTSQYDENSFKQEPILSGTNDEHIESNFINENFAGLVQASSDNLVTELNNHLAGLIQEAQLDPLTSVFTDSKMLGKMNLGLVSSDIISEFALTDLIGLASLNIISIDNTHLNRDKLSFSLQANMPLQLQQDLHTDINGEIRSRIGCFGQSMMISGHTKVTNVNVDATIKIQGEFKLHLTQPAEIEFNQISIEDMLIDYDEIAIKINGLGVLNRFISPLSIVLSRILKSYLTKAADKDVITAINTKLTGLFPIKFTLHHLQEQKAAS